MQTNIHLHKQWTSCKELLVLISPAVRKPGHSSSLHKSRCDSACTPVCDPSTWEVGAGGSQVQGDPGLQLGLGEKATKRRKYLGINPTKESNNLYLKNNKILIKRRKDRERFGKMPVGPYNLYTQRDLYQDLPFQEQKGIFKFI